MKLRGNEIDLRDSISVEFVATSCPPRTAFVSDNKRMVSLIVYISTNIDFFV